MGSSFYVKLFSNSSMKTYPDNTISSYTVQLAHEIDLAADSWEVALCEFSCPPPKVVSQKPHAVFYNTNGLIYCDLIAPQFVIQSNVRCLRTFIPPTAFCNEFVHPTAICNEVFENLYYVPVEKRAFRDITILIIDTVWNLLPSLIARHLRRSFYTFNAFSNSCIRTRHRRSLRSFRIMDPLVRYYLHQAGRAHADNGIGPIYINTPFLQRGHGIGILGSPWRSFVRPLLWHGAKTVGSEALAAGRNIN